MKKFAVGGNCPFQSLATACCSEIMKVSMLHCGKILFFYVSYIITVTDYEHRLCRPTTSIDIGVRISEVHPWEPRFVSVYDR